MKKKIFKEETMKHIINIMRHRNRKIMYPAYHTMGYETTTVDYDNAEMYNNFALKH